MKVLLAHRIAPCKGETRCGDAVFHAVEGRRALFGVIDGLGHGEHAAEAAEQAVAALDAHRDQRDLEAIMLAVHDRLQSTRGAGATVCLLEDNRLTCCGVGNVALRSYGADIPFMLSPGILGRAVRRFRVIETDLAFKVRIILHSDGIGSRLDLAALSRLDADQACAAIFRENRKETDDGSVMVVDLGE